MTKREKKLRLRENEVVHCETYELACKCCELAHSLGCVRPNRLSLLDASYWGTWKNDTHYNFHKGMVFDREFREASKHKVISAEEWLNRHGIFLFGQEVLVRDAPEPDMWKSRYYVFPKYATPKDTFALLNKPKYSITSYHWDQMKSTHPEWIDEEDHVITIDGKEVTLSKESYEALKKAIS